MELNINRIKELTKEEIYSIYTLEIYEIFQMFSFIEITTDEFNDIVLNEIEKSKETYKGKVTYLKYLKKQIKIAIFKKTKKLLESSNDSLKIINANINKNYDVPQNEQEALNVFKKLSNFFENTNFYPTPNLLIDLISQNQIIGKAIDLIMDKYKDSIINGKAEVIFNNNLLISVIDAYCIIHNIELIDDEQDKILETEYIDDPKLLSADKLYFNEMSKIPLLSLEEERELAKRIAEGDDEAFKKLIESNLRLVIKIAKRYSNASLSLMDLIQEGNLGLMVAAQKFDLERGCKFSTYAFSWIRQAILRAIENKGRTIRIPAHKVREVYNLQQTITSITEETGIEPKIEDVAKKMKKKVSRIIELYKLSTDTISINFLIGDEKETELGNLVAINDIPPEDKAIANLLQDDIQKEIESVNLTKQERKVLELHFGLKNKTRMTLEQIGELFGVSRERIRQIEAKAIKKLRNSKGIKELAVYMENPDKALQNIYQYRKKYAESNNCITKVYFNSADETIEKESEEEMPRTVKPIYDLFPLFTKEQVDEMLTKLTDEERKLIYMRYGPDLENPNSGVLTQEQLKYFYNNLIPRMQRLLNNPNYKRKRTTKPFEFKETPNNSTLTEPQTSQEDTAKLPFPGLKLKEEKGTKVTQKDDNSFSKTPNKDESDDKDIFALQMLKILKTSTFTEMMSKLSVKEAVIISLRLGYIDNKYFSTDAIAQFLDIDKLEVIETIKRILILYRENINEFIDGLINDATDGIEKKI